MACPLVLCYCFGCEARVFSGDLRVSNSLIGAMDASLHVLVALLCSTYGVFHVACLF